MAATMSITVPIMIRISPISSITTMGLVLTPRSQPLSLTRTTIGLRGPVLSRILRTAIPAATDTTGPAEKAPVMRAESQAGVLTDGSDRCQQHVVGHAPAGDLGDAQRGQSAAGCPLRGEYP